MLVSAASWPFDGLDFGQRSLAPVPALAVLVPDSVVPDLGSGPAGSLVEVDLAAETELASAVVALDLIVVAGMIVAVAAAVVPVVAPAAVPVAALVVEPVVAPAVAVVVVPVVAAAVAVPVAVVAAAVTGAVVVVAVGV